MLAIDYRIIAVSSGSEIPARAREIAAHFRDEGTPIMIGGGVRAFTLLGIDWNEDTGDVSFLILDPHYKGPEDVHSVVKGSWVAWKLPRHKAAAGGELFRAKAFYNLLCPLRPRGV
jgi:Ufm1-specific protease 2